MLSFIYLGVAVLTWIWYHSSVELAAESQQRKDLPLMLFYQKKARFYLTGAAVMGFAFGFSLARV